MCNNTRQLFCCDNDVTMLFTTRLLFELLPSSNFAILNFLIKVRFFDIFVRIDFEESEFGLLKSSQEKDYTCGGIGEYLIGGHPYITSRKKKTGKINHLSPLVTQPSHFDHIPHSVTSRFSSYTTPFFKKLKRKYVFIWV